MKLASEIHLASSPADYYAPMSANKLAPVAEADV